MNDEDSKRKIRIAFVSEHDAHDVRHWSGTPYFMSRNHREVFDHVEILQSPPYNWDRVNVPTDAWKRELQPIGAEVTKQIADLDVDVVICQGSSMIPYLECHQPIILWHDSMWSTLMRVDFETFQKQYPHFEEWDRTVLEKCARVLFSSQFIYDDVLRDYQPDPSRIGMIPYGGNVDCTWDKERVHADIESRDSVTCQLMFLGKDWERKGLPLVVDTLKHLRKEGVPTHLHIVGCHPDVLLTKGALFRILFPWGGEDWRDHVTVHGMLDKSTSDGLAEMQRLMRQSHFLFHPAHYECYGCALVEANAYGVPVLATDNHGMATIVENGKNGYLYSHEHFVTKASSCVRELMADRTQYQSLARQSFQEYGSRLSWKTNIIKLRQVVEQIITST